MSDASRVEPAAAGVRKVFLVSLLAVAALCWAWIVPACFDMYGSMTGLSAWMMTETWDATHVLLLWAMWVVMMAAMMLPSLLPVIAHSIRGSGVGHSPAVGLAFVGGYLTVWTVFSTVATIVQRLLAEWSLLNPMMEAASPRIAGSILLIAGAYQFTPWKSACLRCCRMASSGAGDGATALGDYAAGVANGLRCVGCCWALMLVLFAGGVMKLWVILALTAVVLAEKIVGPSSRVIQLFGIVLIGLGLFTLVR